MTAPALPTAPQIGSTGLLQQPGIAEQIAPLLDALAKRRLVSAQLEAYKALTEDRKLKAAQQAREAQDAADAADAFYRHISGSEQRLKPAQPAKEGQPPAHQGVDETSGMLIPLPQFEKGLSPQAHAGYMAMITSHNNAIQQGFAAAKAKIDAEHEQVVTDVARAGLARDTAVHDALAKYAGQLGDLKMQRKAAAEVLAIDPVAAKGLVDVFNAGSGRYKEFLRPDGFIGILDSKLGTTQKGEFAGQKTAINQDAVQRGAKTVVDLMDEATALIRKKANADIDPILAHTAENARVLGVPLGAAANIGRTDEQQQFRLLRTRFAHNYVGLLPHSRSAANLLQNLTESYFAPPGSSAATRQAAQRDRLKLRAILDQVAKGKIDLSKIPGFAEAAQAAIAEGQQAPAAVTDPNAAPPNPADWSQGIPP